MPFVNKYPRTKQFGTKQMNFLTIYDEYIMTVEYIKRDINYIDKYEYNRLFNLTVLVLFEDYNDYAENIKIKFNFYIIN